jgi:hypothetical protein
MWNLKTRAIPVITGATGIISKSFCNYVSTIPGNYEAHCHIVHYICTSESADIKVHYNHRRNQ